MGEIEVVSPPVRDESSVEEGASEDVASKVARAVSLARAESDCDIDAVVDLLANGDASALKELSPDADVENVLREETEEEAEADAVDEADGEP